MGLQDWLDKAAPATGLLKGTSGGETHGNFGSFQQPEGPAISRFTGLPVVPARLNLNHNPTPEPLLTPTALAEESFPKAAVASESQPNLSSPPSSPQAYTQPPIPLPDATFTVDTDDLTDFHPLYPSPVSANDPTVSFSETTTNSAHTTFPFSNESASASYTPPVEEGFYVAPAESFTPQEDASQTHEAAGFAWPNLSNHEDMEDYEPWAFTSTITPEASWELDENPTSNEMNLNAKEAERLQSTSSNEDPFGLYEAANTHFSDDFGLSFTPPTKDSIPTNIDDFGLNDFMGGSSLSQFPESPADTAPESQHTHNDPFLNDLAVDSDNTDSHDAFANNDLFGEPSLPTTLPFNMDDLYPVEEQAIVSPSLTIEPPDPEPLPTWDEQQPWATHLDDGSPLEASPLQLLDPVDDEAFASDWNLTLPESVEPESVEMDHQTLEDIGHNEDQDVWDFSEPLSSNATMDEAVDLFQPENSPLPLYTEEALPHHLTPITEEPLADEWQGFDKGFDNSVTQGDKDSFNPTLLDTLTIDDSWLHEAVPEDFMMAAPPQAASTVEAAIPQASEGQALSLPPLAQAFTKNGQMAVMLVPESSGSGVLLKANNPSLPSAEHVLKRFAKNPLHTLSSSTPMTLTEEARLKGKTLYRIELGNWRGIFSHSDRHGFVFQDEWQSD